MTRSEFVYAAVFNGKVFTLAKLTYNSDTTTMEDLCVEIAAGFRRLAEDFDFAAIAEGFEDDGTEDPASG